MTEPGGPPESGAAFVAHLAGFVEAVRARGVTVGVGAELDLGRGLRHVSVLDRGTFLDVCRATLAKSPEDLARIEEAFEEYWAWAPLLEAPGRERGGVVPRSPPATRAPVPEDEAPADARAVDPTGLIRIGVYSPDAPPVGHPLSGLPARRLAAIRSGARRFRRYASSLPGRRFEPNRRGRVDFRGTVRRSLRHGGEWVEIRRRRRKRTRAELYILWDVSGSMREHDSELFALVFSLYRASRGARTFAFSAHLEEITDVLRARPYVQARAAASRVLGPSAGGTRIGRCLREFRLRYGSLVHPWTTLVVVSDGWDLGELDLLGAELAWLRRRSHLVVWVNPYASESSFEPTTAGMREAIPRVDALLGPRDFEARGPFRPVRPGSGRPSADQSGKGF